MGKGRKGQGNGIRPVITAREAGTRRPAGRRVPARTFSCLQLLRFIVFVGGTRGTVGGTACSALVLCGSARLSERGARDALCGFSREGAALEYRFRRSLRIAERAPVLWHSVGQYQPGISRDPIDRISRAKSLRVCMNESGPPGWINAYTRKQESTGVRGSFREAKRRLSRLDQVRFRKPNAHIRWSLRR